MGLQVVGWGIITGGRTRNKGSGDLNRPEGGPGLSLWKFSVSYYLVLTDALARKRRRVDLRTPATAAVRVLLLMCPGHPAGFVGCLYLSYIRVVEVDAREANGDTRDD